MKGKFKIIRTERTDVGTYFSYTTAVDIPTFEDATVQLMKDCRDDEKFHLGNGTWVTKVKGCYIFQQPGHTVLISEEIEAY